MENKKKILIVDDTKSYLLVVSQKLEEEGFSVVTAENGQEGLDAVEKEKPDLILLDIEMPIMNGIEVSKKLKESGSDTPIVFLTNMGDLKHISEAMETSTDYIVKSDSSVESIVDMVKKRLGM
jgi:CheY-like chemotaxis protein